MLVTPTEAQAQLKTFGGEVVHQANYHQRQNIVQHTEVLAVTANQRVQLSNAIAAVVPGQMGPGKPSAPHPGQFGVRTLELWQLQKIVRGLGEPSAIPQRTFTAQYKVTAMVKLLREWGLQELANKCEQFVREWNATYNETVAHEHINLTAFDALLKICSAMVEKNKTEMDGVWTNEVIRNTQMLALCAASVSGSRMAVFGETYAGAVSVGSLASPKVRNLHSSVQLLSSSQNLKNCE